jgi:hypothetical protein
MLIQVRIVCWSRHLGRRLGPQATIQVLSKCPGCVFDVLNWLQRNKLAQGHDAKRAPCHGKGPNGTNAPDAEPFWASRMLEEGVRSLQTWADEGRHP